MWFCASETAADIATFQQSIKVDGPAACSGWVHLQPSVLLLITHLHEKRWLVLFSSRLMLRLMTRLDLPSSWVLLYFTCIIMLFFSFSLHRSYTDAISLL